MSEVFLVTSLYLPWLVFLGVVVTAVAQGGAGKQQVIVFRPQSFFLFGKNVRDVYPPEIELRALGESFVKRHSLCRCGRHYARRCGRLAQGPERHGRLLSAPRGRETLEECATKIREQQWLASLPTAEETELVAEEASA